MLVRRGEGEESELWISSYGESCLVATAWPSCDRVARRLPLPRRPRGMCSVPPHLVYVACYGDPAGEVVGVDARTMQVAVRFEALRPRGIAYARGQLFVSEVGEHRIGVFSRAGARLRTIPLPGVRFPRGVSWVPNEASLLVADSGGGRVVCVREETGSVRWAEGGFSRPNDVAWTQRGAVVSEWRGMVRSVDEGRTPASRHPRVGRLAMLHYEAGPRLLFACDDARGVVHVLGVE